VTTCLYCPVQKAHCSNHLSTTYRVAKRFHRNLYLSRRRTICSNYFCFAPNWRSCSCGLSLPTSHSGNQSRSRSSHESRRLLRSRGRYIRRQMHRNLVLLPQRPEGGSQLRKARARATPELFELTSLKALHSYGFGENTPPIAWGQDEATRRAPKNLNKPSAGPPRGVHQPSRFSGSPGTLHPDSPPQCLRRRCTACADGWHESCEGACH